MIPLFVLKFALTKPGQKMILKDLAKQAQTNPDIAKVCELLGVDLNSAARTGYTNAFDSGKIDTNTLAKLIEKFGGEDADISSLLAEGGSEGLGGILGGLLGEGGGEGLSGILSNLGGIAGLLG